MAGKLEQTRIVISPEERRRLLALTGDERRAELAKLFPAGAVVTLPEGAFIVRDPDEGKGQSIKLASYPRTTRQTTEYRSAHQLLRLATDVLLPAGVEEDTVRIVAEELIRGGLLTARGEVYALVEEVIGEVGRQASRPARLEIVQREVRESLRTKEVGLKTIDAEIKAAAVVTVMTRLRQKAGERAAAAAEGGGCLGRRTYNPFLPGEDD